MISGVNKSARERRGRQNLSPKSPLQKRSLGVIFSPESYFLQGIRGKRHTQNLRLLREDTLAATCSAGPFCLLPMIIYLILGWEFRPRKRIFAPPPPKKNSPQTPSMPNPPPLSPGKPPPPRIFIQKKRTPAPFLPPRAPSSFPPSRKIKNIRNVHQEFQKLKVGIGNANSHRNYHPGRNGYKIVSWNNYFVIFCDLCLAKGRVLCYNYKKLL